MKQQKYEIYNEETDTLEEIEIYGFCHYCHDPIRTDEKWERHRKSLYHKECWEQFKN
jgi:hypothetical protein